MSDAPSDKAPERAAPLKGAQGAAAATEVNPVLAWAFDGRGGASEAALDDIAIPADGAAPAHIQTTPRPPFVWVHLHRDDPRTRPWLEAESQLDGFILSGLLAEDTRPRCTVHGDGAIIILRGVNLMEGAEPEDMVSVRLWADRDGVIGVWVRPTHAVGDLLGSIRRGMAPSSPGELVGKLAQRLADRMEPTVAALHEEIDDFEDAVLDEDAQVERGALSDLRRRAIHLRRYIAPQRDALTTLAIEDLDWLDEDDRSRVREAADKTTRILEELEAVRERAAVVQDEIENKMAEKANRQSLLLTVVAAIFLPLGLLTGLLGINVGGMPGVDSKWAFTIVTVSLLMVAGFQIWVFRKLRLF